MHTETRTRSRRRESRIAIGLAATALAVAIAGSGVPSAVAHGVEHALYAHNSDRVDGRHAVGAGATSAGRAGKLVATNSAGFLPNNILRKAADADRLDGLNSTSFLRSTGTAVDADRLDGVDSTGFSRTNARVLASSFIPATGSATSNQLTFTPAVNGLIVLTATCAAQASGGNVIIQAALRVGNVDNFTYQDVAIGLQEVVTVTHAEAVGAGVPVTVGAYFRKSEGSGVVNCSNPTGVATFYPTNLDGASY